MNLQELLYKDENYTREDIITLLNLSSRDDREKLNLRANEIRQKYFGSEVHLRGIIEFSNYCSQRCLFCGLREDNLVVPRYRMSAEEILESARVIYNAGVRTIVLQSGEDSYYDTDLISYLIYSIKQQYDVALTLSLGQREFDEYKTWKIAGADRYILKHEAANPKLFAMYLKKSRLVERIQHLKYLKRIGYQVGSGNIIGLPFQTPEDIADDILLCKELDVDSAIFEPFVPALNTPYQNENMANAEYAFNTIAVLRLVLKNTHIPATTLFDKLESDGKEKVLASGANVLMPDFTPKAYRESFQMFCGQKPLTEDPFSSHVVIKNRIEALGRNMSNTKGHSIKPVRK